MQNKTTNRPAVQHQFSYRPAAFFSALLITVLMISCKKERATDPDSPAYQITASERLTIPAAVDLPANLPGGNTRIATYYAEGVQKYKAQAKPGTSPVVYEWVFTAPKADLYDITNQKVGTHGAGPYWALNTGDSIFGQQFSPVRSASPDAGSIPWLLLMTKSGKTPSGVFAGSSYIQRIATTGGKAPARQPISSIDTADVFYTAVYRIAKKN